MKSTDDILEKHCPVFGNLFMDKQNKAMVDMRDSILKAMNEHAEQYRRLAKDAAFELGKANIHILKLEERLKDSDERISNLDDDLTASKERNLYKDMKIQQLEAVIDQRDTSIKNLIKINERLNREIEGPDDGLNASHREEDSPRNSGWSV